MNSRHALYFLPEEDSALDRLGRVWRAHLPEHLTTEARVYGFHATLKAPFRLKEDRDETQLIEALTSFAANRPILVEPPPVLALLNDFYALRPSLASAALQDLAVACVRDFDGFRAPLTETELAKRRQAPLTPRQNELLERWGYPYVFDEYRFHMTLSGRLDDGDKAEIGALLAPLTADARGEELTIASVSLVRQDDGGPFRLVRRFALGAACAS